MQGFSVLLLATLIGATIQLNMIGAQSYLLSKLDAIYFVYSSIAAGLMSTIFYKYCIFQRIKFALFSVVTIAVYASVLIVMSLGLLPEMVLAFTWPMVAAFGMGLFRWVVIEITSRHLDPVRAQSYFSYLSSFFGLGVILIILVLKALPFELTAQQNIALVAGLFSLSFLIIAVSFLPKNKIEIKFSKKQETEPKVPGKTEPSMKKWFIGVCICLGAFSIAESYVVNLKLKSELGSFEAVREMIFNYTLVASVLVIIFGLVVGRVVKNNRTSPTLFIQIHSAMLFVMSIICLVTMNFHAFIALEVVSRVSSQSVYSPSIQMILASLMNKMRGRFRALQQFYYYTLMGPVFAGVFFFTKKLELDLELKIVLLITISFLVASMICTRGLNLSFITMMYNYLKLKSKTAAIMGAQALSYLKPKSFVPEMSTLLHENPKKLLRKTIILGLGHVTEAKATDTIIEEFKSDKEEIQIAVLDALGVAKNYESVQFMIGILNMKVLPKSLKVRLNAMSIIASMYHKKAIPILLDTLNDKDPRVVSNALETLGMFRDKKLLPYFKKHIESDVPRVKANSLMACAPFSETKKYYRSSVQELLQNRDLKMMPSILYVVGKLKDHHFDKELQSIYNSELRHNDKIIGPLAWALCRVGLEEGFELASVILSARHRSDNELSFTHFLSQFEKVARFDLVKYIFTREGAAKDSIDNAGNHLSYSRFDFHEELDYFNVIKESLIEKYNQLPSQESHSAQLQQQR